MKAIRLLLVIALGLVIGLGGAFLYGLLTAPDRADRYVTLFREECLTRLDKQAEGEDHFAALADNQVQELEREGLLVTQSGDRCEIRDVVLLSDALRDDVTARIADIVQTELPQLTHPGDDMSWSHFQSWTLGPPGTEGNWGVLVVRIEGETGNALQTTTTTLALPRG